MKNRKRSVFESGGSASRPPGFTAILPSHVRWQSQKQKPERRTACGSGSWSGPASRRSGRIPALPYPPLRSALLYYNNATGQITC